jgi:hypothetical protein
VYTGLTKLEKPGWWRRQYDSPKRSHLSTSLHGSKTQNILLTAVKTSNLTHLPPYWSPRLLCVILLDKVAQFVNTLWDWFRVPVSKVTLLSLQPETRIQCSGKTRLWESHSTWDTRRLCTRIEIKANVTVWTTARSAAPLTQTRNSFIFLCQNYQI